MAAKMEAIVVHAEAITAEKTTYLAKTVNNDVWGGTYRSPP